jgi:hypothetical protein
MPIVAKCVSGGPNRTECCRAASHELAGIASTLADLSDLAGKADAKSTIGGTFQTWRDVRVESAFGG